MAVEWVNYSGNSQLATNTLTVNFTEQVSVSDRCVVIMVSLSHGLALTPEIPTLNYDATPLSPYLVRRGRYVGAYLYIIPEDDLHGGLWATSAVITTVSNYDIGCIVSGFEGVDPSTPNDVSDSDIDIFAPVTSLSTSVTPTRDDSCVVSFLAKNSTEEISQSDTSMYEDPSDRFAGMYEELTGGSGVANTPSFTFPAGADAGAMATVVLQPPEAAAVTFTPQIVMF
jgi:hypothetical protein